jgi:hypothetical protein
MVALLGFFTSAYPQGVRSGLQEGRSHLDKLVYLNLAPGSNRATFISIEMKITMGRGIEHIWATTTPVIKTISTR